MNNTAPSQASAGSPRPNAPRAAEQPAREKNIDAIVAYYLSGITDARGRVGIELEHTIVGAGGTPVSYSEEHGVRWLLEELSAAYPARTLADDGDLIGVARPGEAVTIEPAAQVELSAGPFERLADAQACFDAFESELARILEPVGKQALTIGYHPTARARDLELIPKRRYRFMNLYLGDISEWGPRMMRGSASTQVSIDYSSEADCLRKMRLAYALVPLLSLVADNSPLFEGGPRPHALMRTEIWQKCDPDRCGVVPGVMSEGFTLSDLAAYVLDTPAILAPCTKNTWCFSERTFGELYANEPMTRADVEHAVSMLFNDVRLKTYLEIRPADALPIPYAVAYAGLVKGLFATEQTLSALEDLFSDVTEADIEAAKCALMAEGYAARVYGRAASELADALTECAREGLAPDERRFLDPLAELVAHRETLADRAERA